ncbi:MAG: 50S ribosomal protein L11 methyltransferase [Clostridiaceae bacterium]
MNNDWIEVKVITKSSAVEIVTGIFYGLDVDGVSIEDPEDILGREQGPLTWDFLDINILEYKGKAAVVTGYFNSNDDKEYLYNYFFNKLEEIKNAGFEIGEGKILVKDVYQEDWANNWKKFYKTTKVGNSIIIKPMWEEYEKQHGDIVIEMDPGMAFGTGTHETTKMCIEALERHIENDKTVFDIGTGSGILAICASKLGAYEVKAVDLDKIAVDAAIENIKLNKVENVDVKCGDLMEVVKGKADIVVANIIADVIILLLDEVKYYLKDKGVFIASGIINERKQDVIDKIEKSNYTILNVKEMGEWVEIETTYNGD